VSVGVFGADQLAMADAKLLPLWSLATGDIPGPRDKHTAVVWERGDDDPLMIVYGGRDPSNYLNNQTYVLNLVNHTWRLQKTTTYSGTYDSRVAPQAPSLPSRCKESRSHGRQAGFNSFLVLDMVAAALHHLGEHLR
jgi:hypothetical protein